MPRVRTFAVRLISVSLAAALSTSLGPVAAARSGAASTSLTLLQEASSYSSNPAAPAWCLNEDDSHYRNWAGTLSGTFLATEQLCDYATDGWSAGGLGVQADIWAVGSVSSLAIASPLGSVQQAVLLDTTRVKGGKLQYHYAACVMPLFFLSTNTGTNPLPGGTWTISLSGSATSVNYEVRAVMGYPDVQQQYCPAPEQNLAP